ncbi:metallophosphoesterase [Falsirhodobacter deserti]|uniref:metallophosphoesterase n=1 Tax=Falsirhodobacter deserti TaxID=1365611 RepID=UPI000FE34DFA|nr:metallophosphoesterase [Falsirhodobacter deserti]
MFHLITATVAVYVILRVVVPLRWPRGARILLGLVVLLVSQHHLASKLLYGTMFAPDAPRLMMIAVNWLFGAIILSFAFQLVLDIAALLAALLRRRWVPVAGGLRQAAAAAALLLAGLGVWEAIRVPDVRRMEIAVRGLPPEFDGFRIVQLTDLHLSRIFSESWARGVVERTNALEADLVAITGDLIDGSTGERARDIGPLADLRAADGVFMVTGNHEYYFGYEGWMDRFRQLGLTVLANSHEVIRRGNAELVLAGVTDWTALRMGLPAPDLQQALAGAPDAPVILLDHQPRGAAANAAGGADLQLSGHTHGGMILGLDRIVARFNNGFVSGLYDVDGMALYTSNGTGLWMGFTMRLGRPSEITEITLRPAS